MTLARYASPRRAARYYTRGKLTSTKSLEIPAILWLWVLLVGLAAIRRGSLAFDRPEVALFAILAGLSVLAGTVAPRIVQLFLVGLLLAGVLGAAPQVESFLADLQARIDAIYGNAVGRGPR